jgi:hypothetical protein
LQTVARNGRIGYVQQGGIWEIKAACFDLDSALNPEWRPSIWFKSNNFNTDPTRPYVEFDLFELYNREDHNVHSSRWIHKADFPHPDDIQSDKFHLEDHEFARCPILPEWRVPWYLILWADCTTTSPTTDVGPWDLLHIDFVKAWAT